MKILKLLYIMRILVFCLLFAFFIAKNEIIECIYNGNPLVRIDNSLLSYINFYSLANPLLDDLMNSVDHILYNNHVNIINLYHIIFKFNHIFLKSF